MNLFEKSGQSVGDNSSAIQVTGDAHFGNTTTEVMAICQLVVKSEMASLREDAYALVNSRAQEFGHQIAEKLSKDVDEKLRAKLADPDIQYTLNQAVVQVARKGIGTKSDILKELIVTKIKSEEESEDLVIDQAIDTIQRLTTSEIKLMSLIMYFRYTSRYMYGENLKDIIRSGKNSDRHPVLTVEYCKNVFSAVYNNYSPDFEKVLGELDSIKLVDTSMMQIKGCFLNGKNFKESLYDILKSISNLDDSVDADFKSSFPLISDILSKFGIDSIREFDRLVPSPVGKAIAENYLKCHGFLGPD